MSQKWEAGARAVIVVSEHVRNWNRIVTLTERWADNEGVAAWVVEDGKLFDGWIRERMPELVKTPGGSDMLLIHQWKLRLLDEGDPIVVDAEEIERVAMA
ncbi:hypothetical protein PQR39_26130 [Paraburkholderia sediminicola]|uniref:hypothetical protein n=1 Tax=Paraburkholderia sediminicola TaxID=458836 RepID=UPI0038B7EEB1